MGVVDVDTLIVAGVDARVVDERMVMIPPANAPVLMAATGAVSTSGTGEVVGIRKGMVELVMFTIATLVAFATGSVGVVNTYGS